MKKRRKDDGKVKWFEARDSLIFGAQHGLRLSAFPSLVLLFEEPALRSPQAGELERERQPASGA